MNSKTSIPERLRALADDMVELGAEMEYYGGIADWSVHGLELIGAARMAREWADSIEAEPRA